MRLLAYVMYAGQTENSENREDLIQTIKSLEFIDEEKIMTLVDHLKPAIYERGVKKGREEVIEKGRHQEKIEMARALFSRGIDMDTVASVTKLAKADLRKILN